MCSARLAAFPAPHRPAAPSHSEKCGACSARSHWPGRNGWWAANVFADVADVEGPFDPKLFWVYDCRLPTSDRLGALQRSGSTTTQHRGIRNPRYSAQPLTELPFYRLSNGNPS